MGRFTKRLRAAFGRRQVRAAPPAQVPGGYVDRHPYVDCLVAAASRVPQADAEVDRAVKAIAEGDLAALQSACETLAQLGAEIGEHAVEATKLVRAERIRQIDQPERQHEPIEAKHEDRNGRRSVQVGRRGDPRR